MLEITRGNTDDWEVAIDDYVYTFGDVMTFVMKEQPKRTMPAVLSKELEYDSTDQVFRLHFDPEDTAGLECYPDMEYWFDIAIELNDGRFYTVVAADRMRIMPANAEKPAQ